MHGHRDLEDKAFDAGHGEKGERATDSALEAGASGVAPVHRGGNRP